MISPKPAFRIILGLTLLAFTAIGCGGDEKKDAATEKSESIAPATEAQDTTKMDTASTRPVKTGN
jgi:hypothetical protein